MSNKHIDLFKEMIPAIELGFKDLWDAAGEDGQKEIKNDLWNLNRYISSIEDDFEKQAIAIVKVNEYYNKNWAALGANHPKLQWQLLCVAGKTGKKKFHPWIGLKKKKDGSTKAVKLLLEIYPDKKIDEVELLARISTKKEIIELAREHGFEKVNI